jgi:flagellar biosynthesis anti-sigma factor FlgM
MTIDIKGLPGGAIHGAGEHAKPVQGADAPAMGQNRRGATPATDTVNWTAWSSRLRQLEATLGRLPVVDARRVEAVQRQLATGHFAVDPAGSAQGLLELECSLP